MPRFPQERLKAAVGFLTKNFKQPTDASLSPTNNWTWEKWGQVGLCIPAHNMPPHRFDTPICRTDHSPLLQAKFPLTSFISAHNGNKDAQKEILEIALNATREVLTGCDFYVTLDPSTLIDCLGQIYSNTVTGRAMLDKTRINLHLTIPELSFSSTNKNDGDGIVAHRLYTKDDLESVWQILTASQDST